MRLQLNLKTITADKLVAEKLLVKVIVNGSIEFKSEWAERTRENIFPFFEKNLVQIPDSDLNYIKFEIRNQDKYLVAQKTLLNQQAKGKNQLEFLIVKDKIRLKYELIQTLSDDDISLSLKPKKSNIEQPEIMKSTQGKLQILKLGSNVYIFSQRLDPVIWLVNQAYQIVSWTSPSLTIGLGVVLTLVIMNLKLSLFAAALFLIFGKNILIKKIEKINKKKNFHNRLWVPKQNTVFLQSCITTYNSIYEKIHQFCLNQDKTDVVNVIHHICRASLIVFMLLFILSPQKLAVVALWTLLFLSSPQGIKTFKQIWPSFLYFQKQTQKVTQKLTEYLKLAIGQKNPQQKSVVKQFYFYQYERWFMGKGWSKPIGMLEYHFADQSGRIQVLPKNKLPDGWVWLTGQQIYYGQNADNNGYEYTNELSKKFSQKCSFATVRRRKFVRKCELIFSKSDKNV